jgi:hypothetical protein
MSSSKSLSHSYHATISSASDASKIRSITVRIGALILNQYPVMAFRVRSRNRRIWS